MSKASIPIVLTISLLLLIQIVPMNSSGAPVSNDLYIASVDLIQVIDDPPAIIKNKSVAIRLVVINTFSVTVHADFRIKYDFGTKNLTDKGDDGLGIPLSPGQNTIYLPGGSYYGGGAWDTDPLTIMWTSPGHDNEFWVFVDPANSVDETVETNNVFRYSEDLHVVTAQPMRLLVVPVSKDDDQYDYQEYLDRNLAVLRDQYPVANDGIQVTTAPWEDRDYTTHEEAADIARSFSDDARSMGYDRVIVVFKKLYYGNGELYGRACGMLRDPEDRVPFLVTLSGLYHSSDLLAHELGHTYYLWHPHDIGIELYETDIWNCAERKYAIDASTTMSYDWKLPEGVPSSPRWMDEERYHTYPRTWIDLTDYDGVSVDGVWEWNLYDQFVRFPRLRMPSVLIAGTLYLNGSAILSHHVQHLVAGVHDLSEGVGFVNVGNYSIRLQGISHDLLGNYPFQASFTEKAHWDSVTDVLVRDLNEISFAFNIPEVPGVRYMQILNQSGAVLVQRVVSEHAPQVQVLDPEGGEEVECGQTLTVNWAGNDVDGDDLSYKLAFSSDNGCTWVPMADELTDDHYEWNTSGLELGDEYLIKVIVSDGYHSAEGVSDSTFSMIDQTPPNTTIEMEGTAGQNGWYVSGVSITLNATDNHRVNRTEYSNDGMNWTVYEAPFNVTGDGESTLRYRSVDEQGNVEDTRTANVLIDKGVPQVQIISPTEGMTVRDSDLTVGWNSSDVASGIAAHRIRLDAGEWMNAGAVNEYKLTGIAEGEHTLEVMAIDAAGNSAISTVEFVVEDQGPGIDLLLLVVMVAIAIVAVLMIWRFKGKMGRR